MRLINTFLLPKGSALPLPRCLALTASLLLAGPCIGQAHAAQQSQHHHSRSEYVGAQSREIKALSVQQQADLAEGKGMGASLTAELNGYPGPGHVLELAFSLGISDPKVLDALKAIHSEMSTAAKALGTDVIAAERVLQDLVINRPNDREAIRLASARSAELQGQLRYVHIAAHLKTHALLTPEQIEAYGLARGYLTPDIGPYSK